MLKSMEKNCKKISIQPMARAVEVSGFDEEKRTATVVWTTGADVLRSPYWGEPYYERLEVSERAIRMERMNNGLAILDNHKSDPKAFSVRDAIFGAVERNSCKIIDGKGYADLKFSERHSDIYKDVQEGIINNVSVGYKIHKFEEDGEIDGIRVLKATDWEPTEISLVPAGADPEARFVRGESDVNDCLIYGVDNMIKKEKETIAPEEVRAVAPTIPVVDVDKIKAEALAEGERSAFDKIEKRKTEVDSVFANFEGHDEVKQRCLDDIKLDVRSELLEAIGKNNKPASGGAISVNDTRAEDFAKATVSALLCRSGIEAKDDGATHLKNAKMEDLARDCLEIHGVNTRGLYGEALIGEAFEMRTAINSTSTFPKILENIAEKAMLKGHSLSPEIFDKFTKKGSLSDYKISKRSGLGHFNSLPVVREGGEYEHITISEGGEPIQLAKHGGIFTITREAILNDDLGAFTDIPMKMGLAAKSTVGDIVWNIILNNYLMDDGNPLFHASHSNIAAVAAAPTVASLAAARVLMGKQKSFDGKGKTLNAKPAYGICCPENYDAMLAIVGSESNPAFTNSGTKNTVRNMVEVLEEGRLSDTSFTNASSTAWFLAASQLINDTIEVAYLNGNDTPFMETKEGWDVDGAMFKVRMEAAAIPLDFRSFVKNAGA